MGVPWRRIWKGVKVALDIAIDLHDAGAIKVKELEKVKTIRDVVEKHVPATK